MFERLNSVKKKINLPSVDTFESSSLHFELFSNASNYFSKNIPRILASGGTFRYARKKKKVGPFTHPLVFMGY